ncbi:MAG: phosphatidylserine decarboxylase [Lachnospiraceae bacterium]|nr:phosphatidylserine decarboxylase [Lachnospiraceae bacterium]
MLRFLYDTIPGRILLRPLVSRPVSRMCGRFLDTGISTGLIRPFVRFHSMNLSDYDLRDIHSFNDFFCRRLRPGKRVIDPEPQHLIAPCDGLLRAYPIRNGLVVPVKESRFDIASLLQSRKLAARYDGGICVVFRLCVDNYHRYCYVDSGVKTGNRFLPGKLHTVRPIALRRVPVFAENCREYTLIRTKQHGTLLQMEVGALFVGRIQNLHGAGACERGQEKGRFLYGGSTVIVLLQRDTARLFPQYFRTDGREMPVRMGQAIGTYLSDDTSTTNIN